jgi:hypothetical protein
MEPDEAMAIKKIVVSKVNQHVYMQENEKQD